MKKMNIYNTHKNTALPVFEVGLRQSVYIGLE